MGTLQVCEKQVAIVTTEANMGIKTRLTKLQAKKGTNV
jgi:hypothetical protein